MSTLVAHHQKMIRPPLFPLKLNKSEKAADFALNPKTIPITNAGSLKAIGVVKRFKWVISKKGKLLALPLNEEDGKLTGGPLHPEATGGEAVYSAGWGEVVGSAKVKINNRTGHYPSVSEESLQYAAVKLFRDAGIKAEIVGKDDISTK